MSPPAPKPTGVFVRLPLSTRDIRRMDRAMSRSLEAHAKPTLEGASEAALLAIGVPVPGRKLEVVAYDNIATGYLSRAEPVTPSINLVRQSEAQAQIAARDAEIVQKDAKIHEYRMLLEQIINKASLSCVRTLSGRESRLLAGACADAREALKGGAA